MIRDRSLVVVHLLLFRDGELLLLRRAGTGYLDGLFVPPGGHRQGTETLRAAALRECREETGVAPDALEPVCALGFASADGHGLNFVFEAELSGTSGEPRLAEPDRADAIGWFSPGALPHPVPAWLTVALAMRGSGRWFQEPDPLAAPERP